MRYLRNDTYAASQLAVASKIGLQPRELAPWSQARAEAIAFDDASHEEAAARADRLILERRALTTTSK